MQTSHTKLAIMQICICYYAMYAIVRACPMWPMASVVQVPALRSVGSVCSQLGPCNTTYYPFSSAAPFEVALVSPSCLVQLYDVCRVLTGKNQNTRLLTAQHETRHATPRLCAESWRRSAEETSGLRAHLGPDSSRNMRHMTTLVQRCRSSSGCSSSAYEHSVSPLAESFNLIFGRRMSCRGARFLSGTAAWLAAAAPVTQDFSGMGSRIFIRALHPSAGWAHTPCMQGKHRRGGDYSPKWLAADSE